MEMMTITSENRDEVNQFISSHWFSMSMVVRGKVVDMTELDGFVVYDSKEIIGLVTYRVKGHECEIMSMDSLKEKQGIGTSLVKKVIEKAKSLGCTRLKLITTNDNIYALKFYQKLGFDMTNLYRNALDLSRKLKPSIPLTGNFDIPLKHEIEFELNLE